MIPEKGSLASLERIIILMKQLQDSDRRYRERNLNNFLASAILGELSNQSYLFDRRNNTNPQQNSIMIYVIILIYTSVKNLK